MKHIIYEEYDNYKEAKQLLEDTWDDDKPMSDNDVFEFMEDIDEDNWQLAVKELKTVFNGSGRVFILTGYAGTWCGDKKGGCILWDYKDLQKVWSGNYSKKVTIYEAGYGKLCIDVSHHDGINYWEVRELTNRGKEYLEKNENMEERKLHERLSKCPFSKNIHFVKEVWG